MLRGKKPPFSMACQHGSDAHIVYATAKYNFTPTL
jgi:hypothetical protein